MSSFTAFYNTPTPSNNSQVGNSNNNNAYSFFLSSSSAFSRPTVSNNNKDASFPHAPAPFTRKRTWGDDEDQQEQASANSNGPSTSMAIIAPSSHENINQSGVAKRPRGPLGDITNLYRC